MEQKFMEKCELFVENRNALERGFKFESGYMYPMCSSIYTTKGLKVDVECLKECLGILKAETGIFSNFRGHVKMALISMMAVSKEPEVFLSQVMEVYERMKKERTFGSEYLVIAAAAICNMGGYERREELAERTKEIYRQMKEKHPLLTSSEDYTFAALLAVSGLNVEGVTEEMERCYKQLKPEFFSKNAVQSLSHMLALTTENTERKCAKVMDIFRKLKEQGKKFGTDFELPVLGGIALMEQDADTLVSELAETDNFLKGQKGFSGILGLPSRQRLMYAALLVMSSHMPKVDCMETAAVSSVVSLLVAQQAAIGAAIAASAAVTASATS